MALSSIIKASSVACWNLSLLLYHHKSFSALLPCWCFNCGCSQRSIYLTFSETLLSLIFQSFCFWASDQPVQLFTNAQESIRSFTTQCRGSDKPPKVLSNGRTFLTDSRHPFLVGIYTPNQLICKGPHCRTVGENQERWWCNSSTMEVSLLLRGLLCLTPDILLPSYDGLLFDCSAL